MFLHAVLMELHPTAGEAFHAEVQRYCRRIRDECSDVLGYEYVANRADRAQEFSYAVISHFVDEDAHDRYQVSFAHQEMKAFMAPHIRRMVVFDNSLANLEFG